MSKIESQIGNPRRLKKVMELSTLPVRRINIRGKENLDSIPQDINIIAAVSHVNDLSVPIAATVLADHFCLLITDISKHRSFTSDPLTFLSIHLAGRDNFLPIDYGEKEGRWSAAPFNPRNFEQMAHAQERGRTILIAAHNPSINHQLPTKGGVGAVYLASKTNSLVLPIAVDVHGTGSVGMASLQGIIQTFFNRPEADVNIGTVMDVTGVDVEAIEQVDQKRNRGGEISDAERIRFRLSIKKLREKSDILMRTLAKMLPLEKRGPW